MSIGFEKVEGVPANVGCTVGVCLVGTVVNVMDVIGFGGAVIDSIGVVSGDAGSNPNACDSALRVSGIATSANKIRIVKASPSWVILLGFGTPGRLSTSGTNDGVAG